jgi:hypothetical protein
MSPLLIGILCVMIVAVAVVAFPRLPVSLIRRAMTTVIWIGIGVVALFLLLRGLFFPAAFVVLGGLVFLRYMFAPQGPSGGAPRASDLSIAEACQILGLGNDPSRSEVETAYKKLIQKVHPDHGGSDWLAARLTAARDRLLSELKD